MTVRYAVEPLAEAMGMTVHACLKSLGVSGTTMQVYRETGVTARVADSLAVRAGFDPYQCWPQMLDDAIADAESTCEADDCDRTFIPSHLGRPRRFCGEACSKRTLLRTSPTRAELNRQRRRAYYAENADYERARQRRSDQAAAARKKAA